MEREEGSPETFERRRRSTLTKPTHRKNGKLEPKWEGLYIIKEKYGSASFMLSDAEGNVLPHSWNADNLRRFFI